VSLCEVCNKNDVEIHLGTSDKESLSLCWECNNKLVADRLGINLTPFQNGIYEYSGIRGKIHKFIIRKMIHPTGIGYEATEFTGDNTPGFKVNVLDDLYCDQQALFHKLEAKIKKTISKRYLKTTRGYDGNKQTNIRGNELVGRFEYDKNNDEVHKVVIDGQVFSWEELGRMLNAYEGFQFKLKIYDMTDEIK